MMNTRIIELLQQPKLITSQDLTLLEGQIQQYPYIQNIRALYLYGINQYQPNRYKEILTKTAAYTTDKKILYQFVNQKSFQKSVEKIKESSDQKSAELQSDTKIVEAAKVEETPIINTEAKKNDEEEVVLDKVSLDLPVVEELAEELISEEISKEETIEVVEELVVEEPELIISNDDEETTEVIADQEEQVVLEDNIEVQSQAIEEAISFDAIDDFLPNVKFSVPKNHSTFLNPPKFDQTKEDTINTAKLDDTIEEQSVDETIVTEPAIPVLESKDNLGLESKNEETAQDLEQKQAAVELSSQKVWQPMQFDNNLPDALIGKSIVDTPVEETNIAENIVVEEENLVDNKTEELNVEESSQEGPVEITQEASRPIINASFFSDELSIISENNKPKPTTEKTIVKEEKTIPASNVGKFINTWQSWLKIDRSDDTDKETEKEIQKNRVIEQFIENQPKISQLKDEVNFVIKEKKEDISHLMTETLANLYLEQRLYTKAIKAFEILITKHPDKKKHFLARIEEIKDIRKPF
ncbi:hypothetical protein [Chryseobacterium sp. T1]